MSDGKTEPLRAGDPRRVGTYRLVARLGAGGMGRVYLGRSPGGRPVAVKVIHPHLAGDPEFRRRFGQEIAAARRVGGVHTAQVVDAGTDADPPWLVTEYIAGPSLQEAVGEHGPLSAESVAGLGAGLAEGLKAVHERNVIHRDLKPGNVLLARDGPRIIDFGIARALDATSQTTRTSVVGTPGFMSPEQFRGREVGRASDVFCLAAVLAFAATGRRPFGEGPIEALGYRVVNEEPDLAGVPESLLPLIAAGLAKDPDDRPGLDTFLERCSTLVDGGEPPLPDSVTTMIATRVAETEALVPPPGDAPRGTLRLPRPGAPRPAAAAGAAAVAGVLVVAFAIWAVAGGGDEPGSSGTAVAQTSPTRTPAATRTPTPGASASGSPTPTPTPTRDPVREAFEKISEGDCLDAYRSPHDGDWTSEKPRAVDCSRADARLKVLEIEEGGDYANCGGDSGDIDGALWWRHGEDEQEIALCVERRLEVGDCFLATDGPEENTVSISNGDLMTSVPCGANSIPGTYDHILKVTAITRGECPPAHRDVDWEFRGGKLCTRIV
ncbi:serine/threonine-protein kinase [Actinomadura sp. WMMB 499]|uniref:serine/threonine-protein kinase n=1 Tax=Actinomadura sp. WMMB 499 TaxID=1219491 RepID=UPI0020C7C25D|nr:serine/threonine-protein kinase [Actinomadura sp. WMMB 499]